MASLDERIATHNPGQTHYPGCESDHIVCALVAEVYRLREKLAALGQNYIDPEAGEPEHIYVERNDLTKENK